MVTRPAEAAYRALRSTMEGDSDSNVNFARIFRRDHLDEIIRRDDALNANPVLNISLQSRSSTVVA